ncbi:unnamed protein product [Brassicogethes aeneus]|uniref:FAM193 C-terminal domain-containing protein n=1 Tax=Brassicogethes aeneus TaxID=1431903 RepID=A0A9P0BB55_BRAAE|nr:unnamed protein product [Brassicogethes aeneus]
MNDFGFIELLIKQTCRRSSYEFDMGLRQSTEDSSSVYSLDFLKKLYDKPKENIHRLLKIPEQSLNGVKVNLSNGISSINYQDFTMVEKKKFLDFLNKIKEMEPPEAKCWSIVQHYMHYVYRNFVSCNPEATREVLAKDFIQELREAVTILLEADESQFYIRLFALLREYCIFAHWNFSKSSDKENSVTIKTLVYYYEAMLSAAKCINTVFPELEALLNKNYSVCWIDFNNFIFINYFFDTEYVQNRIYEFQNKINPTDTSKMFELLGNLRKMWIKEQKRINELSESSIVPETSEEYETEHFMMEEHTKILARDFWVDRITELKDKFDLSRFDHHIFRLLSDSNIQIAGPILDKNGQCICENCLVGKYQKIIEIEGNDKIRLPSRIGYCRKCNLIIDLNFLHKHVTGHRIIEQTKNYRNGRTPSSELTKLLADKLDLANLSEKFSAASLEDEPIMSSNALKQLSNDIPGDVLRTKDSVVFDEFMKHRKDSPTNKSDQVLNKNAKNFIKIKKDIFNNGMGYSVKHTSFFPNALKKSETSKENDNKIRELLKSRKAASVSSTAAAAVTSKEPPCKHSCKHEEDLKAELKKGCKGGCEHHKESKNKCDCTYCEVFGTAVSSHTHKKSELRDKLRIRLHQRREKRTKDPGFKVAPTPTSATSTTITNSKVQKSISKLEERVPPPTATFAPAPIVQAPNPSPDLITDDISGLLNYIEGNTSNDKMAIVDKKAAKKERQRQKKEEERLKIEEEERRKQAEERRKEEDRKRAEDLAKQLAEKARIQQMSKKERKRMKKNKTAGKQADSKPVNDQVVEETIPAMVTIKRVAENGGQQPTVTITLKGSTPDQDKLLYTLVNGADKVDAPANNKKQEVLSNNNKKKNKNRQEPAKQVLSKELKVTLALDPSTQSEGKKKKKKEKSAEQKVEVIERREEVSFPMLKLPPGITITKVEGPISNRNFKASNLQDQPPGSTINVGGKSGVIVVDTEKLIQQNGSAPASNVPKGKKSKRRKKKAEASVKAGAAPSGQMVTLKNPIFQSLHSKPPEAIAERNLSGECAPAAIFTSENGMVTIRSSRLQQSLSNGTPSNVMPMPIPSIMPELKPVKGPEMPKPAAAEAVASRLSPFNAQEILSGLPGIEITKVDKRRTEDVSKSSCQTAQVSIIPTNNGDKFTLDKDDWTYDSVFTPKDIPEDDMDADERELEAFKRFCQQSVPPKTKEKVAHLNVKDIVLKKKSDTNCV